MKWFTYVKFGSAPGPAVGPFNSIADAESAMDRFLARHGYLAGTYLASGSIRLVGPFATRKAARNADISTAREPEMRNTENKMRYAVIDRDGFFRYATTVYSAHATVSAAIRAAKQHRMRLAGNQPNQSSAMVIRCESGFAKGEKIYGDTIRRQYPVVW